MMSKTVSKYLLFAGALTLVQAVIHLLVSLFGILQWECIIDWLQWNQVFLWIRLLYFQNAECGMSVNVGQVVSALPLQAQVVVPQTPETSIRTRILFLGYFGVGTLWFVTSVMMIIGASDLKRSNWFRIPWIAVTSGTLFLDVTAGVTYLFDVTKIATLQDLIDYIDGRGAAINTVVTGTDIAAYIMAAYFWRGIVLWIIHIALIIKSIYYCSQISKMRAEIKKVESNVSITSSTGTPSLEVVDEDSLRRAAQIPRPTRTSLPNSQFFLRYQDGETEQRPGLLQRSEPNLIVRTDSENKKRLNFPESLLSIPQKLERMLAKDQRQLQYRASSPSLLSSFKPDQDKKTTKLRRYSSLNQPTLLRNGRRATVDILQGQLPWSYIPGELPHRMRDQLPPDEELPPVPVPDYTLHRGRKQSVAVKRGMANKSKDMLAIPKPPPPPKIPDWRSNDVLY